MWAPATSRSPACRRPVREGGHDRETDRPVPEICDWRACRKPGTVRLRNARLDEKEENNQWIELVCGTARARVTRFMRPRSYLFPMVSRGTLRTAAVLAR